MTDSERERLRAEKRERLRERAAGGDGASGGRASDDGGSERVERPEPIHVDGADALADLTSRDELVLVDFYAEWCGPCRMMEPALAALARDSPATVAKVDIDRNQELAQDVGVRGVPTHFLYVEGEPVKRLVGMQSEAVLADLVEQYAR